MYAGVGFAKLARKVLLLVLSVKKKMVASISCSNCKTYLVYLLRLSGEYVVHYINPSLLNISKEQCWVLQIHDSDTIYF